MHIPLAYAENFDSTQQNFVLVLLCGVGLVGVGVLAGMVIALSRRRAHRHSEQIFAVAVFWGMIALGSIIYAVASQLNWGHQYMLDLQSGYGNPQETGPALPWAIWGALGAIYVGLIAWTMWKNE
jgi:hypothetical protein